MAPLAGRNTTLEQICIPICCSGLGRCPKFTMGHPVERGNSSRIRHTFPCFTTVLNITDRLRLAIRSTIAFILTHQVERGLVMDPQTPVDRRQRTWATESTNQNVPERKTAKTHSTVPTEYTDVEIYYGTMFGSAERYARELCHSIQTNCRACVSVQDLDGFDESHFARRDRLTKSRLFVFVASTHFAGAPSPSAERFCDWLRRMTASSFSMSAAKKVPNGQLPVSSKESTGFLARLARLLYGRKDRVFDGMQYAVFGLGDSQFLTYNYVGKFLDAKLTQLGATPVLPLALGDVSNNDEASYRKWEAALLLSLPSKSGLRRTSDGSIASLGGRLIKMSSKIRLLSSVAVAPVTEQIQDVGTKIMPLDQAKDRLPLEASDIRVDRYPSSALDNFNRPVRLRHLCRVVSHDMVGVAPNALALSENHAESTPSLPTVASTTQPRTPRIALFDSDPFAVILPVDIVGSSRYVPTPMDPESRSAIFSVHLLNAEASYTTVSTLSVFPQNSPDTVAQVADAFGFDLDAVIELVLVEDEDHSEQHQLPFPTPCTVRTALTEFLELRTVTREFVRSAAGFVATSEERELLENLTSTAGTNDFREQFEQQHKGIIDLVEMVPSLQLPLEVFVNIVPTIKPRCYNIGSASSVMPRDLDVAVSLPRNGWIEGFATEYFERILHSSPPTGVPIRGFISLSRFQFQDDGVSPLILIAAGTGLSPMRAILQERLVRWMEKRSKKPSRSSVPKHVLFYGCFNEDSIVYRDDLRRWEQQLFIRVHYSFSNDAHHPPRYVQDTLAARIDEIVQLVGESANARICACGLSPMIRAVREVFENDQVQRRKTWFDTMYTDGRYIEEAHN